MERYYFRMNSGLIFAASAGAAIFLMGCQTVPPGVERGPHGTIAYDVLIEASPPGARIEANGEMLGPAPLHLKIFGDQDGTFHDFGSRYYVIQALPVATNRFVQTRVFRTGHHVRPEDYIPRHIYFDMNQNTPQYLVPPGYPSPAYGPPVYYYPPYYYGPAFGFYFGPGYRRHW
ncbi:MAG: hypothetical protein ABSD29_07955 [Verrucomicrobiota bacterium]|jgi:hypothetical protein